MRMRIVVFVDSVYIDYIALIRGEPIPLPRDDRADHKQRSNHGGLSSNAPCS